MGLFYFSDVVEFCSEFGDWNLGDAADEVD
jgi:hypothetical protein